MHSWMKFALLILLIAATSLSITTPSFGQTTQLSGDVHLDFTGTLNTTAGVCKEVTVDTIRFEVPEGTQGVIDLTATRSPNGSVTISAGSLPSGWPGFSPVQGLNAVAAQYAFTVPAGYAGSRFTLVFQASTSGVPTGTFTFILDVVTPEIAVSPTSLDFGEVAVGTTAERELTIKNVGGADLWIGNVAVDGGASSPFDLCGIVWTSPSLAPGQSIEVKVCFSPETTGSFNDVITISSGDPINPELKVPLQGATKAPRIFVWPERINFVLPVGQKYAKDYLSIFNVGEAELWIGDVTIKGGPDSPFDLCGKVWTACLVPPHEWIHVEVCFSAKTTGFFEDEVLINSNDPNTPVLSVPVKGVVAKTPEIEEIIVTGIPNAKNITTDCPSTAEHEKVRLEAKIIDAPGFEVYRISWSGDVTRGEGPLSTHNPYEYTAAPGTHGRKFVICSIFYRMIDDEKMASVGTETEWFDLFFVKTGRDRGAPTQTSDNWYHYWSNTDDAACSYNRTSAAYQYGGGSYIGTTWAVSWGNTGVIRLYNRASMDADVGNYAHGGLAINIDAQGVDCVEVTLAHERQHVQIYKNWQPGGVWRVAYGPRSTGPGGNDIDGDRLPNAWEDANSAIGFNKSNNVSFPRYPISGGDDEEVLCDWVSQAKTGIASNDWANPGKQSDPKYRRIVTETGTAATLTDAYTDHGRDANGNGLYDDLSVEVGVNVGAAGTYTLFGNLYDSNGNMLWAENHTHLDIGNQSVLLSFDGLEIRQRRVDGPYTLQYLTLFGSNMTDEMSNPYYTSAYRYSEFERPATVLADTYSDYGTDIDGDGLYDYLTIAVGVNAATPEDCTVEGWLCDGSGNSIVMASDSTYLNAGSQSVILKFDGLAINRNRVDGPYYLRYLNLSGSDQIDLIYDAYTTSVYSYTDFQKTNAGFTGSYSDYGEDTDGDGLYDYLTVEVGIDASASANYSLIGWLYDRAETEIVWTSTSTALNTGSQTVPLDFEGVSISKHGVDGPYDLKYLALYAENGTLMDTLNYACTTAAYDCTDFETILNTDLLNVRLISADPPVTSISVSSLDLSEIDETYKPQGLTPRYAYAVDATGAGNFTLEFRDVSEADAIAVYKIDPTTTPPNQWVESDCATTADTVKFTMSTGDPAVVFGTLPEGGCFIATTAYGTPMAQEIEILREFRDEYLLTNPPGRTLVELYYGVSPPLAEFITENPSLKPIVRAGLVPAVAISAIVVGTTPTERIAIIGFLALVSVAAAVWATRRRGRGLEHTQR